MNKRTIWKASMPLAQLDNFIELDIPEDGIVLSCASQFNDLAVWFATSGDSPLVKRRFHIVGTGQPLTGDMGRFIGTAMFSGGSLVFHVFEVPNG